MENENEKQSHFREEIEKLDFDLSILNKFIEEFDKTVEQYKVYEVSKYLQLKLGLKMW